MSAIASPLRRRGGRVTRAFGSFVTAVTAVTTKELRGRMRGRRAFVVVTIYLLLLSVFAFALYSALLRQSGVTGIGASPSFPGIGPDYSVTSQAGLSASIGHALFSGLLMVETLLVLVLAPAFTSGAISLEREKQTLDLLVTTPLSTLGMVVGKLISALTYVFLLIIASIPLASLVFVFGGVGPDELVRGYVVLFALAFGMGAIGLFISALVKRTQTATVLTYVIVLALTIGSFGAHLFLVASTQPAPRGNIVVAQQRHKAPEAMLWLNPFVADLDLVCATAPGSYHVSCSYMSVVTGRPYFGSQFGSGSGVDFVAPACPPGVPCPREQPAVPQFATSPAFGFPRDTFWPKSAAAFLFVGVLLTLASAQLVAPTRRLRLRLPLRRSRMVPAAAVAGAGPAMPYEPESQPTIEEIAPAEGPPTEKVT